MKNCSVILFLVITDIVLTKQIRQSYGVRSEKDLRVRPISGRLTRSCCLVTKLCLTVFATLLTVARQAPLSMGFPRQEYWSGLPFPSPGDLPVPGIEPISPALASKFFTTEPPGKPLLGEVKSNGENPESLKRIIKTSSGFRSVNHSCPETTAWEGKEAGLLWSALHS